MGAIFAGGIYALLWQLPAGQSEMFYFWYFLAGSVLFYLAYTMFATPWVALGFELTADYHERTRLMGVQNFIGQLAYVVTPWFLWFMTFEAWFDTQLEGASVLAVIIGVFVVGVGVLPAIFLQEPMAEPVAPVPGAAAAGPRFLDRILDFFQGFVTTLRSGPFQKLCIATFLVFNGFILISSFQFYVIIYYVFAGDQEAGAE